MPIRRRNKMWQADVLTPTGQRVRKSFPTRGEADAFTRAAKPDKPARASAGRVQTITTLMGRAALLGKGSAERQAARQLIAAAGAKTAGKLTLLDVRACCDAWNYKKPGTRLGYHGALRDALAMLGHSQLAAAIPHVTSPDSPTLTVSDADVEQVMHIASPAVRLCLLLCREAALRVSTAHRLSAANIVGGEIHCKTKWDGAIRIPMTKRLRPLVEGAVAVAGPGQPLIEALMGRNHADARTLATAQSLLRRHLRATQKLAHTEHWTWHDLRRTAAQRLFARSHNLRDVQMLLGHRTLHATLHYLNAARHTLGSDKLSLAAMEAM